MKTIIWTLLILLSLAVHSKGGIPKTLPGKVFCGDKEITDWTVNKSTTVCRECPVCPTAYGSTFPCGGVMRYPHEKPIRCERCINGKTFSSSSNTDMCSPCTNCWLRNRKVLYACTVFKDTVCGGCEDGFYEFRNESTGNNTCEKCSRCCDDGKDNKKQECIDQGLQSSGQICSVFDKERCKPKPTRNHRESSTNMARHNVTLPMIQLNHLKESEQGTSHGLNVVFLTVALVALLMILGAALTVWYWWKNKKNNSNRSKYKCMLFMKARAASNLPVEQGRDISHGIRITSKITRPAEGSEFLFKERDHGSKKRTTSRI